MPFKSYTNCVQPNQYKAPDFAPEAVFAILGLLGAVFSGGITLILDLLAGLSTLEKVLDYLLNGKLICLGRDACAVGTVASFETVHDKSFPDNVDDDFSINLMLYPLSVQAFLGQPFATSVTTVEASEQGALVTPNLSLPKARDANDIKDYAPYKAELDPIQARILASFTTQPTGTTDIPVLHCECEGSRVSDLLSWLEAVGSLGTGGGLCSFKVLGIPIGRVICTIVQAALLPVLLVGLVAAWFNATDGNPDDARTDPNGGELQIGDILAVTGRWTYDAAHTGWNEFHPVKTIHKVDPASSAGGADLAQHWCDLLATIPPPDATPATMTPPQLTTWQAQQEPANQWTLHPAVDGCQGSIPPPPQTPPSTPPLN